MHDGNGSQAVEATGTLADLHMRLFDRLQQHLQLAEVRRLPEGRRRAEVRRVIELLLREGPTLAAAEQEQLVEDLLDDLLGLGPLDRLLRDPSVGDILVNGA